ncbi:hypothetical protein MWU50_09565 [Flavobacteriaceae bacterium S0862]|nr:hypothetical protein [Flavobacteriaceae bacterium S0862]
MKLLFTIFSLIIIPKECNNMSSNFTALQERQDTIIITYEAVSRGFFEEISLSKDSLTICNDINKKDYKTYNLSKENWSTCLKLLSKIDMNGLSELEAPTTYRYSDGAPHATLIIKDSDKEIRSSEFDHGHPPNEIKELVEKLLTIKKMATKQ